MFFRRADSAGLSTPVPDQPLHRCWPEQILVRFRVILHRSDNTVKRVGGNGKVGSMATSTGLPPFGPSSGI